MFHTATEEEIKRGDTTDIYFRRTKEVLKRKKLDRKVIAEVSVSSLPEGYTWGILAGIEEVAKLLEDYNIDVYSLPEGNIFHEREPVLRIEGYYSEFCELETPILGLICQASGISTKAARFKKFAGEKPLLSFGIRRMHPAISPMIDRSAYIGGCDGFSGIAAEKLLNEKASGTMSHAFIIIVGDQKLAWTYYYKALPENIPRIALVDTYCDEKIEAVWAAETIKDLNGVRIDTPKSRRGDIRKIVEEVRWELDIRGYKNVKIFVSGGINEEDIVNLKLADGFGVGTSISAASTIDFALDIVEIDGMPVAKRGKLGGKKFVYRCPTCLTVQVIHEKEKEKPACNKCSNTMEEILLPLIKNGKLVAELPEAEKIREKVLEQLKI